MSCNILDHAHINALVSYAVRHNLLCYTKTIGSPLSPTDAGKMLMQENVRSFCFRYKETVEENQWFVDTFTWRQTAKDSMRTPIQIIKACDCYDYQACETSDYWDTPAAKLVSMIRKDAIRNLSGYEEAEWSIPHA